MGIGPVLQQLENNVDGERDKCIYTFMKYDDPKNCLTFHAQRIARSMGRQMELALQPVGLTNQQFTTLTILRQAKIMATSELAEIMGVERTTMTRNIEQMRRKGWLEPTQAEDRRVKAFQLTKTGTDLQAEAYPLWQAQQTKFLDELGTQTATDLIALAHKV